MTERIQDGDNMKLVDKVENDQLTDDRSNEQIYQEVIEQAIKKTDNHRRRYRQARRIEYQNRYRHWYMFD